MNDKALWFIKVVIAACLAFIILNLLTCIYRGGLPVIADETLSTPVKYVPNSYYSDMTEGITFGIYDENGYNNAFAVDGEVDYLCLGSSQMEAKEVMPNQNSIYYLNEKLNSKGEHEYAYNIGISGEHMTECINRLNHAINTYNPKKAVILETGSLDFPQSEIDEALGETKPSKLLYSYDGIMGIVRKLPYVRLVYIQFSELLGNKSDDTDNNSIASKEFDSLSYNNRITPLIKKAVESANGLQIIIFYHPRIIIDEDGSVSTSGNEEMIKQFQKICSEYKVGFVDMSERFIREYEEDHTIPYGFANTSVGMGHLNRFGHKMIAEELYKQIQEVK